MSALLQFKQLYGTCDKKRLGSAILLAILTGLFYLLLPHDASGSVVRYAGYWFTFIPVLVLIVYLGRFAWMSFRGGKKVPRLHSRIVHQLLLSWVVGLLLLLAHASFGPKILMDDAILSGTSRVLHESRQVHTPSFGRLIENEFRFFDGYLDKRPWLYAFFVSTVHDITGFRIENAYATNMLLAAGFLLLLHLIGFKLGGPWAAVTLPLLWISIPLFTQNATGGGMDMMNLFCLSALVYTALLYLEQPSRSREAIVALAAVLLAYSRYESLLFVGLAFFVIVAGWMRSAKIFLSWPTVLAAPMLLGLLWQHKFVSHASSLWELHSGASSRFSLSYFPENLVGAFDFFFAFDEAIPNSPLLAILGFPCLLLVLVGFLRLWRRRIVLWESKELAMCCIVPFLLLHLCLILFYLDGRLDQRFAARFALPAYLMLTLAVVWVAVELLKTKRAWGIFTALCFAYVVLWAQPQRAKAAYSERNFVVDELRWIGKILEDEGMERGLLVDDYTTYWTLHSYTALPRKKAEISQMRIAEEVQEGKYTKILIVRRTHQSLDAGEVVLDPVDFDYPEWELSRIAACSFKAMRLTEVYRVENLEPRFGNPPKRTRRGGPDPGTRRALGNHP